MDKVISTQAFRFGVQISYRNSILYFSRKKKPTLFYFCPGFTLLIQTRLKWFLVLRHKFPILKRSKQSNLPSKFHVSNASLIMTKLFNKFTIIFKNQQQQRQCFSAEIWQEKGTLTVLVVVQTKDSLGLNRLMIKNIQANSVSHKMELLVFQCLF